MPVTIHPNQHKQAYEFLQQHPVGVIATVDPHHEPHAAAIYFSVDDKLNVSFLTKTETKKADNLRHNNHAVLLAYDGAMQTTVQIKGVVSEITDDHEVSAIFARVLSASMETSGNPTPLAQLNQGDYVVYKLKPTQVRMAVFSRPKAGESADLFKTIVLS